MKLTTPLALSACALAVCTSTAWAQDAWSGTHELAGEQGDRATRVTLTFTPQDDGSLRVERKARFVGENEVSTWTTVLDGDDQLASGVYTVSARRGSSSGLIDFLRGRGRQPLPPAPENRISAVYTLSDAGHVTEELTNETRRAPEDGWTQAKARATPTIEQVRAFLEEQSKARPLTRLGAQWHVLRMAHWRIDEASDGRASMQLARNPYNADTKHTLFMPLEDYPGDALYDRLEQRTFPNLLKHRSTRWSYEGASYHYVAAAHRGSVDFAHPQSGAAGIRAAFGDRLFVDTTDWALLDTRRDGMAANACPTVCLADMEEVIARGTLLSLSHRDLVNAVQGKLPELYGCVRDSFTGRLTHNYDMRGYVKYGKWAFVGRPLYYRAMDKRSCSSRGDDAESCMDVPAFQGENLVLTKISDAGVRDFGAMGGFGTVKNLPNYPRPGDTVDDEIAKLSGVSRIIATYWKLRRAGRDRVAANLIDRPFFNETETSVGGSLGDWVRKLYETNERTPYKIFAYDYGYASWYYERVRKATNAMPSWRS